MISNVLPDCVLGVVNSHILRAKVGRMRRGSMARVLLSNFTA